MPNTYYSLNWLEYGKWLGYIEDQWLPAIIKAQIVSLPDWSWNLESWERARARYPTKEQWLALNPSPGQSYVPFPTPRPK